jgi:GNAT superfamily N-acetyltransferase
MKLIATYTPEQHRGKGYAKLLVDKAVEVAREKGLKIIPICSYAIYYFIKNPELRSLLAEPYNTMGDEELRRLYEERLKEERSKGSVS